MKPEKHIVVSDIGGTNVSIAIFAYASAGEKFLPVRHETLDSRTVRSFPAALARFVRKHRDVHPAPRQACIDFAGPIAPDRAEAVPTNLPWRFTAREVAEATGLEVTLLNDFEAIGFGLENLIMNRPEAFVRLSSYGRLPPREGRKPTAVVIGAGTGLGTTILVHDSATGRYRPVAGERGHTDFIAHDELELQVMRWIQRNVNASPKAPVNTEKILSGPGLVNVFHALAALEPDSKSKQLLARIRSADPAGQPALITARASTDPLCRKSLDLWIRSYARAAKNSAIFPLAPGGVFLAGGIAAKILPEMQSGLFMREFHRCDIPNIRRLLKRTPVYIVTDYRIGLYGCANAAVHFAAKGALLSGVQARRRWSRGAKK